MADDLSIENPVSVLEARLVSWRVFSLTDLGAPELPDRSVDIGRGPRDGDELRVSVGPVVPARLTEALMDWRAFLPIAMSFMFGGFGDLASPATPREIDESHSRNRDTVSLEEVFGSGKLWLTLTLERPIRIRSYTDRYVRWLADTKWRSALDDFAADAKPYLDYASTVALTRIDPFTVDRVAFDDPRIFVVSPGKCAFTTPNITDQIASGGLRIDFPMSKVEDALQQGLPEQPLEPSRARKWLYAALIEPSDNLRRFLFAFMGLEILAAKLGKAHETQVIDDLVAELDGAPLRELAWPSTEKDTDRPWRNLVFRFAVLALYLFRDSAANDLEVFKRFAKTRNEIAHGQIEDIDSLPSYECLSLLSRYIDAATAAGEDV